MADAPIVTIALIDGASASHPLRTAGSRTPRPARGSARSTLTRGSPSTAERRAVGVLVDERLDRRSSGTPRSCATRAICDLAYAGEMCGSSPLPDAVTASTGTLASAARPFSCRICVDVAGDARREHLARRARGSSRTTRWRRSHRRRRPTAAGGSTPATLKFWPTSDEPTSCPFDAHQAAVRLAVEDGLRDAGDRVRVRESRAARVKATNAMIAVRKSLIVF